MYKLLTYTIMCLFVTLDATIDLEIYNEERKALLNEETIKTVGGKLLLNENERIANNVLMKWKMKELNASNPHYVNFCKHYLTFKKDIEKSKVYQMIRKMPKGAVLHTHSTLMLHADVLMKFTYEEHLYACFENDDVRFMFSKTIPGGSCSTNWSLLSDLRNSSKDPVTFDLQIKRYLTLDKDDGEDYNSVDANTVWKRFRKVSSAIASLISYRPVREKYIYEMLKQLYEDNVMYVEIRTSLYGPYELDGTKHQKEYLAYLYKNVSSKFIEEYPDFIGVKMIITQSRSLGIDHVLESLNEARRLKAQLPDLIAGFDLVGQEDTGKPLIDFIPILSEAKHDINFYLHAGETAWLGTKADENLVDAILLGAKRIGHGFALWKHPSLMSAVMKKNIALEVNVISNVVLSLVRDVRSHPLALYLAMGLPVVLSSDDPGAWSAEPLSHDFFVAFMGVASRHADLRLLKQLALNSITYSALDAEGKSRLLTVFNKQWNKFVEDVISDQALFDATSP